MKMSIFALVIILIFLGINAEPGPSGGGGGGNSGPGGGGGTRSPRPPREDDGPFHGGVNTGDEDEIDERREHFEGILDDHRQHRRIFSNGTGVHLLNNCTEADKLAFETCRDKVKESFRNASEALKVLLDAAPNGTEKHRILTSFWCSQAGNRVRLMGACIRACKGPKDNDGFFHAGRGPALDFCRGGMNNTGLAPNRTNFEDLRDDFRCPPPPQNRRPPTCPRLVDDGLEVSLAEYEADLAESNTSNASTLKATISLIMMIATLFLMF